MDNLHTYEAVRSVPKEAQKPITGGNLNGFTDINPMWRIKKLTELYGPCGTGWKYTIEKQWIEPAPDGRTAAFCNVQLFVKDGESWSAGIPGTGGSMFVNLASGKQKASDECYKMALTDALSVCCKMLGFGADIYWEKDRSKYDEPKEEQPEEVTAPKEPIKFLCADCGKALTPYVDQHGKSVSIRAIATQSQNKFGRTLCVGCATNASLSTDED